jgi:ribose 5-phosphate isomerase B
VRIAIGNDHRGFALKQAIINLLKNSGHHYQDFGSYTSESVDYPDYAHPVAEAVSTGEFDYGILICSTGIGMCIAANKVNNIRAALCRTTKDASRARQHNNANVLCLAGDDIPLDISLDIVSVFLSTTFEGGRHQRRLDKIRSIESS